MRFKGKDFDDMLPVYMLVDSDPDSKLTLMLNKNVLQFRSVHSSSFGKVVHLSCFLCPPCPSLLQARC